MTTNDTTTPALERNYPLPAPESDPRFTFGLLYEVAKTIEAHGYPPLTGRDVVELQVALLGVLYAPTAAETENDADPTDHVAIERGAQIDAAVESTGHLPGHHDADSADQAWFWTADWQTGEREANEQISAGGLPVYDDMPALFADLDERDADGAPDEITAERALDAYLAAYPTDGEDWGA